MEKMEMTRSSVSQKLLHQMKKESATNTEEGISSAAVSVPFSWESQPGTPRVRLHQTPLPPLTPPPSYYYNMTTPTRPIKKKSQPKLLSSIFQRSSAIIRRTSCSDLSSSPASSSSSSSSSSSQSWSSRPKSYSVTSSSMTKQNFQGYYSSSPRQSCKEVEAEEEYESPVSTLCFGSRASARSRGCWYSPFIKLVLH